ncbi:prephenate dehydrogenase [Thalassorhabdus alkalitolerans]|uniref:Prephenate dehydrogenase n=1 Tax=Thalassorhabdus alkalitolerans TaxID=2282697 RepID=A0ABW0YTZ6_9BACI
MSRKVCVVGLGLIGGSIALAIQREHDAFIIGVEVDENQLKLAESLKIIDQGTRSLAEGVCEADLIIFATPVTKTEELVESLKDEKLKPGVIITDVGSTKKKIFEKSQGFQKHDITFIGGHPMAGSHKTGVQAAKAHLFENAYYILTPAKDTPLKKVIQLQNWLKGTKAKFIEMTPDQHDKLVGVVSHFPHIVAAGLVHQVASMKEEEDMVETLAAGGFRDITRIASASPVMWRDILLHNKEPLLDLLEKWQVEMDKIHTFIKQGDKEEIYRFFERAKLFRDGLPSRKKGAIPSFYDLYVDVPDHPGVISDVTGLLATEGISITNIRIIETREDIMGVLRLTFRSDEDRERGKKCLQRELYETYVME